MLADVQPLARPEAGNRDAGDAECGVDQGVAVATVWPVVGAVIEFDDEAGVAGGEVDDDEVDGLGGNAVERGLTRAGIASGDGEQIGEAHLGAKVLTWPELTGQRGERSAFPR